ncbi:DUF4190 domain-containing protein [Mycobacterium angelicum]|nr:DUF4190 domain-containing protein [Mycobacterium angelicum]
MTDQPPEYPPPPPPTPPPGGYGYPPPAPGYGGYPPPAPGGYGYPPPSPGYLSPQVPPTNTMAIAALVSSLVGWLCFGIGAVLGLIFGIISLNQIKQSGERGRGMAIAGIVISGCEIALFLVFLIIGAVVSPHDNDADVHRHHRSQPAMVAVGPVQGQMPLLRIPA